MIEAQRVILGFGAVGAIASCFHPGSIVIGRAVPGSGYQIGPLYLYDTPYTRSFCDAMDIAWSAKTIRVGWLKGKELSPPSRAILEEYHIRVRGGMPSEAWLKTHLQGELQVLDIEFGELFWAGRKAAEEVIKDTALSIYLYENKVLTEQCRVIPYDKMISTVPMPVFAALVGKRVMGRWKPIWIRRVSVDEASVLLGIDIENIDYDYLNIIRSAKQPYRATVHKKFVDLEYTYEPYGQSRYRPFGKILSGLSMPREYNMNIEFAGRWAEWRDGLKLHDVIERWMKDGRISVHM